MMYRRPRGHTMIPRQPQAAILPMENNIFGATIGQRVPNVKLDYLASDTNQPKEKIKACRRALTESEADKKIPEEPLTHILMQCLSRYLWQLRKCELARGRPGRLLKSSQVVIRDELKSTMNKMVSRMLTGMKIWLQETFDTAEAATSKDLKTFKNPMTYHFVETISCQPQTYLTNTI